MPSRKTLLSNNNYYHIFNHGFRKVSIIGRLGDPTRMMSLLDYYRFKNIPTSYSLFLQLSRKLQMDIIKKNKKQNKLLVEIIAFCLMPNHYHLILKQVEKDGIKNFATKFQNSYAKFFNIKNKRAGPVFQNRFKSVLVLDDTQLLHLSRYIHLNPYSSNIVKKKDKLFNYHWSSFRQYLDLEKGFCHPEIVLDQFKNSSSYKKFVFDQADYQKSLDEIKHLAIEN